MTDVDIKADSVILKGILTIPKGAIGMVLFAHGSGSSRFSKRNQFVAEELNKAGIATLLLDLLTVEEEAIDEQTAELRFDIELLAGRLEGATKWLKQQPATKKLNIGYFGASTGAAAALFAAAAFPDTKAVVSRGGRPDLAYDILFKVDAPTLLIVGGNDTVVIGMNEKALKKLKKGKLEIVPGATHLFEEPGKLEEVAQRAADWFKKYLQ